MSRPTHAYALPDRASPIHIVGIAYLAEMAAPLPQRPTQVTGEPAMGGASSAAAPAYARLLVDSEGLVWTRHSPADHRIQGDWDAFEVEGEPSLRGP